MAEPEPAPGPVQRTVGSASRLWAGELACAGIEHANDDVRRLMAGVLGLSPTRLLAEPERPLAVAELAALSACMARRLRREPVSRILGWREFYGRPFAVTPTTLDPRPDTETLVEAALEIAGAEQWAAAEAADPLRILDVGTGSGCILTTLLCELKGARGTGTDISPEALDVARANAERLGVGARASWLRADGLESVDGPFHILVSNPPYVRSGDIAHLEPEVRRFDPATALDGGADGLELYRRFAPQIARIVPEGWAVLEVGYDQADAVAAIMTAGDREVVADVRTYRDVAGKRRCVAVKTRAKAYAQKCLGLSEAAR
ncbi:MAG TPA: peptide chain release factor N(5)-glutamine methyltransferase [Hyphomicrobiaceae bacterium]|nr:peptide chain release factor N(5)-glutamine methyltransferase [Hyphomicrobiaceae bacterium]